METTRRSFLKIAAPLAVIVGAGAPALAGQFSHPPQPLPEPPDPGPPTIDPHVMMTEDQKIMRSDVDKLFVLAQELKDQVAKANPAAVLSLALVRKAAEIEKLAHQIQKLAKG